jgi:hypothetical protein
VVVIVTAAAVGLAVTMFTAGPLDNTDLVSIGFAGLSAAAGMLLTLATVGLNGRTTTSTRRVTRSSSSG